MERVEILHVINTCGNQDRPAAERWKDIVHVNIADDKTISGFKSKVDRGEIEFVDIPIGGGTESGRITGFYLLEYLAADADILNNAARRLTFIDCKNIMSLSFANSDTAGNELYSSITDFMNKMYHEPDVNA